MSIAFDPMTGMHVHARAGAPQRNSWPALSAGWRLLRRWAQRHAQRRALAELAALPHRLDDVGLTRPQALREAGKPFWRR
jgi:uncharacterized protein YjiS (DUF1127 family)